MTPRKPRAIGSLLTVILLVSAGSCDGGGDGAQSDVSLSITGDVGAAQVSIWVRDAELNEDDLLLDAANRDLAASPVELAIDASGGSYDAESGAAADGLWALALPAGTTRFLIVARGLDGSDAILASDSEIVELVTGQSVEVALALSADKAACDADEDGFFDCGCATVEIPAPCDCLDSDPTVSPLRDEICDDGLDNNCSGSTAEEGCGCTEDQPCTNLTGDELALAGVGACTYGVLACIDGVLSETCEGGGTPGTEVGDNGIDDDCDGTVDEGGSCSGTEIRKCLLGEIDLRPDCALGEQDEDCAASALAIGTCRTGFQMCVNGAWDACAGEVRPNIPVGGTVPAEGIDASDLQCDGLDNDCDGLYDEEPAQDADGDGYTSCGTCRLELCGDIPACCVEPMSGTSPWLVAEAIDCNDLVATINPGAAEDCRTTDDDDCRCDHDDGDPGNGSEIGLPSVGLDGSLTCPAAAQTLDCAEAPRSDPSPIGICSDTAGGSDAYYFGFEPDSTTGDCHWCDASYGDTCDPGTGACTAKVDACEPCATPGAVAEVRPLCCSGVAGTCTGTTAPDWECASDADPADECPPQTCNDAGADGGPFFYGIQEDGNGILRCYYRADVEGLCLGEGACWARRDECLASGRGGEADTDYSRPACHEPTFGSCTGETPPSYQLVANNTDPYDDCPDESVCDVSGNCT